MYNLFLSPAKFLFITYFDELLAISNRCNDYARNVGLFAMTDVI